MRIAFFGSSLVSAYWNGAATYYRGMLSALARHGHTITFYEPDAFERQQNRDMEPPPWARSVVYPATAEGLSSVLERAADADAEADSLERLAADAGVPAPGDDRA